MSPVYSHLKQFSLAATHQISGKFKTLQEDATNAKADGDVVSSVRSPGVSVRQLVIGVMVDRAEVEALLAQCPRPSWSKIAARFNGNPEVKLTRVEADSLADGRLAFWVERRERMLIGARLETFARLSDLSARVGFDGNGNTGKCHIVGKDQGNDWVGPFIRARFLKRENSKGRT